MGACVSLGLASGLCREDTVLLAQWPIRLGWILVGTGFTGEWLRPGDRELSSLACDLIITSFNTILWLFIDLS